MYNDYQNLFNISHIFSYVIITNLHVFYILLERHVIEQHKVEIVLEWKENDAWFLICSPNKNLKT